MIYLNIHWLKYTGKKLNEAIYIILVIHLFLKRQEKHIWAGTIFFGGGGVDQNIEFPPWPLG